MMKAAPIAIENENTLPTNAIPRLGIAGDDNVIAMRRKSYPDKPCEKRNFECPLLA
jgi:hypothetical protein